MKYLSKAVKLALLKQGLKICTKCKETLPLDEFHNNASRTDGKTDWCKPCSSAYKSHPDTLARQRERRRSPKWQEWQRQYWQTDAYKESQKRYRQSQKGKAANKQHGMRYKERYPERAIANDAVHNAIRDGKFPSIQGKACESCGNSAEHYHHWSYLPEHRLDVIPLCHPCHVRLHCEPAG